MPLLFPHLSFSPSLSLSLSLSLPHIMQQKAFFLRPRIPVTLFPLGLAPREGSFILLRRKNLSLFLPVLSLSLSLSSSSLSLSLPVLSLSLSLSLKRGRREREKVYPYLSFGREKTSLSLLSLKRDEREGPLSLSLSEERWERSWRLSRLTGIFLSPIYLGEFFLTTKTIFTLADFAIFHLKSLSFHLSESKKRFF